jgi:hypothetical protein
MNKKMYKYLLVASIYALLAPLMIFGQYAPNPDQQQKAERRKQQRDLESNRGIFNSTNKQNEDAVNSARQKNRTRVANSKASNEIREDKKRIAALRVPDAEDSAKYKEFLKQSKTGLFRLFPDLGCQGKNVVRVDGDCLNVVLSSSAFSFRQKNYVESNFWDIRFKDGNLFADGFLSQEIILSLGDVPLENISLASDGIRFLSEFKPEPKMRDAKRQFNEISQIINADGYKYGKSAKAQLNTTYALRIVAFRNDDKKTGRLSSYTMSADEKQFWDLKDDKRIDLIIAFRIVRQDKNDNITILWKELDRQTAPSIVFTKDEKLSDIKP